MRSVLYQNGKEVLGQRTQFSEQYYSACSTDLEKGIECDTRNVCIIYP